MISLKPFYSISVLSLLCIGNCFLHTFVLPFFDTAKATVALDRAAMDGNAEYSFSEITGHWTWWLQSKLKAGEALDAYEVAQMIVGFKHARGKSN